MKKDLLTLSVSKPGKSSYTISVHHFLFLSMLEHSAESIQDVLETEKAVLYKETIQDFLQSLRLLIEEVRYLAN